MNETTTPTKTRRTLPRYEGAGRLGAEAFASPIPPRLMDAMADTPEAKKHRELAAHFEKARSRAVKLASDLERVKGDDSRARAVALASGKTPSAPKSERIELDLRQAREDVSILAALLRDTADELLDASTPFVQSVHAESERDAEAAVEEVRRLLDATLAAVEEAEKRAGEFGWIGSLSRSGVVWPWRDEIRASSVPSVRQAIGIARGGLDGDLAKRDENLAARDREQAAAMENPPPGTTIWREGRTLVVGPAGEFLDAEDVER